MIEIAHGRSTGGGLEQVGQVVRADATKHSHGSDGPGFHVGLVQMENQTVDGKVGVCRMEIVIPGTFDQNQKPEKITYGAGISTAIKYFPDKRGFAGGLVTAVYGFSSVIVPPIAQVLTQHYGIMNTFVILGTVFALVIMFCGYFCERCPEDFNPLKKHGDEKTCIAVTGLTWRQMLASPIFWPMIALLMCGAVSAMMILSQAASIAQNEIGMNATSAAAAVSGFPYGWNKGDTCVMITNKTKKSTCEYTVESYDGRYFGVQSHTGLYHRVSPWRMFRTREEAVETLLESKEQGYGGMTLG